MIFMSFMVNVREYWFSFLDDIIPFFQYSNGAS